MNYTKELTSKDVKFEITLSKEEWQTEIDHVYEHMKGKFKVEGFRNGKAPRKVIEKQYGEAVFYDEALNHCFYEYYEEVLSNEKDVEIIGNPRVDIKKIDSDGLILVVTQALKPEVKLGQYKDLELEKPEIKVSAKEVNDELKKIQEKSARMVKVEREVKNGDTAVIDFSGSVNGKKFDGGTAKDYELVIGSGSFIPGFEEQIIGMKAGETKNITVKFPEEYPAEELKGKDSVFEIVLHEVREKVLPSLDDEFAKNISEFDTLDEYKKDLKKQLLKDKQQNANYKLEEKMIETITNNAEVEIPEIMVDEQVNEFINDFEHRLSHQGLKLADYLSYTGQTIDELKKSRHDDALKTCKTRLVLGEIIKAEKITVEDADLEQGIALHASYMGQTVEEFKKNIDEHELSHIANEVLINKLMKFLKTANNV